MAHGTEHPMEQLGRTLCPTCGQPQREAGLRFCDACGAPLADWNHLPQDATAAPSGDSSPVSPETTDPSCSHGDRQPSSAQTGGPGGVSSSPARGAAASPKRRKTFARRAALSDPSDPDAPMGPLAYCGSLFLTLFPGLGILVSALWARGHCRKTARRDLARAVLALHGLFAAAALVLLLCFRPTWKRLWRAMTTEPSTPVLAAPSPAQSADVSPFVGVSPVPSPSKPGSSIAEREIAGWDTGQPVAFSGFPSAKALNVLLGGRYYIKYTVFAFGATQEWEQAQLEGRSAEVTAVSGRKIRTLTMDGVQYECDDEKEVYCIAGQGTASNTTPFGGTLSALERIGGGEGQVNGVDCLYDEFLLQSTGASEVKRTVRLYVKNEALQAIYMEEPLLGGQVMMQVQVLTQDVPKNLLEFPASYTQVSYADMVRPGAAL